MNKENGQVGKEKNYFDSYKLCFVVPLKILLIPIIVFIHIKNEKDNLPTEK